MNPFLAGGALAGIGAAIVGFWNQLKAIIWKVVSIVVEKVEISTEEAHEAVTAYLVAHFKRLSVYDRLYGATNDTFRNGKYGLVPFERFGSKTLLFWSNSRFRKWIPFAFSKGRIQSLQNPSVPNSPQTSERVFSSIIFIRRTLDVDLIISEATAERNQVFWKHSEESASTRFDIFYLPNKETNNYSNYSRSVSSVAWYKQGQYRLLGVDPKDLGRPRIGEGKALSNLFFPDDITRLIEEISLWVNSQEWYRQKNLPWKKGWLLYGPPGTGKTALVRAFAEDLNMPIYAYSLSEMSNSELTTAWRRMQVNIPCIALIEDIDMVFDKRRNISQESAFIGNMLRAEPSKDGSGQTDSHSLTKSFAPLTFDCLLNCIDGVEKSNGIFTIITTNDVSKIDPALGRPAKQQRGDRVFVSSRPGRIDKAIGLTYMEKANKIQMAQRILSDFPDKLKSALKYINRGKKETAAQFQEYCSRVAMLARISHTRAPVSVRS